MAAIEYSLSIPAEHYENKKSIGTDEIELSYWPLDCFEPYIRVAISTKDSVNIDTHIDLCDAVALRDFLNTIIPAMEKQDKENRSQRNED